MNTQFKKGVLELVVMVVVNENDIYGYELVKTVCEIIEVNEGTIYPLLKRMTIEKYFDTYLRESTEGPPRKYYKMTTLGREEMIKAKEEWLDFSKSINKFLEKGNTNE